VTLSDHSSAKSVGGGVGAVDDLVEVVELEDALHWAEDLLLRDGVLVLDVGEDGRLHEPSAAAPPLAARHQRRALPLPRLNVPQHSVHLLLTHQRSLLSVRGQTVSQPDLRGHLGDGLDVAVVEGGVDEGARPCHAGLSGVEEETGAGLFEGSLEVGVLCDDIGRLSTELQRDTLQVMLVGISHDIKADLGRAGEGHLVNPWMADQMGANITEPGDDVDHSGGKARLIDQLGYPEGGEGRLLGSLHDNSATGSQGGP
jgi:hypothetical protein